MSPNGLPYAVQKRQDACPVLFPVSCGNGNCCPALNDCVVSGAEIRCVNRFLPVTVLPVAADTSTSPSFFMLSASAYIPSAMNLSTTAYQVPSDNERYCFSNAVHIPSKNISLLCGHSGAAADSRNSLIKFQHNANIDINININPNCNPNRNHEQSAAAASTAIAGSSRSCWRDTGCHSADSFYNINLQ